MVYRNYNFDINKLLLIGAFITLAGDFVKLLITYQVYCDSLTKKYKSCTDRGAGSK